MNELEALYQEIILDHHKRPQHFHALPNASHRAAGHNPLCGDEIEVYMQVEDDRIRAISFQGQGCAISRASASIMTSVLTGKTLPEAHAAFAELRQILQQPGEAEVQFSPQWEPLAPISGVRRFPARIKCATLAWHAMESALAGVKKISTE